MGMTDVRVVGARASGHAGRRSRRLRARFALVAALIVALSLPAATAATNFGSQGTAGSGGTTNGVWLTPDVTWTVARVSLENAYFDAVTSAVQNQYGPTDLSAFLYTATFCSDASHDECVFDSDYGDNGLNGWNACAGSVIGQHPTQECSMDYGRINLHYSPPAGHIACHEIGHSVGLRHSTESGSCLVSGGPSAVLTTHDKGHLNANY